MKLPDGAERVFQGIIFDVYQWQQELFNGETATFEMLKRPSTLTVIATQGDSIVMAEEEQPLRPKKITLFGGRQEEGEEPLAGAKRELLEEAGLVSDDWELYRIYQPVLKIDWQLYVFIARNCRKEAQQHLDGGESITVKTVSFEEFLDIACSESFGERDLATDIMRMRLGSSSSAIEEFKTKLFSKG